MQVGECGALQVIEHLGHGGGPTTLHDAGLVISHAGVATGVAVFAAVVGVAIASEGDRTIAISRSMRAIIWSLPDLVP
jgi:hypothetical protein